MWRFYGQKRPAFAQETKPGQESVWDYPRPPKLQVLNKRVRVVDDGAVIAESDSAIRVLETASPPGIYIPQHDINMEMLEKITGHSVCEWKGRATYWKLKSRHDSIPVAWSYARPNSSFMQIKDYLSFYPGRMQCYVNDEIVLPQPGQFYGGWITSDIAGPFKGESGTAHW